MTAEIPRGNTLHTFSKSEQFSFIMLYLIYIMCASWRLNPNAQQTRVFLQNRSYTRKSTHSPLFASLQTNTQHRNSLSSINDKFLLLFPWLFLVDRYTANSSNFLYCNWYTPTAPLINHLRMRAHYVTPSQG